MEIWEGAIIAVGGLWLVGYMSRKNGSHPLNSGIGPLGGMGTSDGSNLTTIGTGAASKEYALIPGEPVAPPVTVQRYQNNMRRPVNTGTAAIDKAPLRPIAQHL